MSRRIIFASVYAYVSIAANCAHAQKAEPHPGHLLSLEVVIAEAGAAVTGDAERATPAELRDEIAALHAEGQLDGYTQIRLTAVESQQAMFQLGQTTPMVTGRTQFPGRGATTSRSRESTGTLLSATARVLDEGMIAVQLELEQSKLDASTDHKSEAGGDAPPQPPSVSTLRVNTTLSMRDGETAVVGGSRTTSIQQTHETLILVTARVIAPAAKVAGDEAVRVFHLKYAAADEMAEVVGNLAGESSFQVVVDARTNSIVARGNPTHIQLVESLLSVLDRPMP